MDFTIHDSCGQFVINRQNGTADHQCYRILLLKNAFLHFPLRRTGTPPAYIYGEGGYEERIQRADHHR